MTRSIDGVMNFFSENPRHQIPPKFLLRGGDGIVGQTTEHILGLAENNRKTSDFADFEIKTKSTKTSSRVTLFNKGTRKKTKKVKETNWNLNPKEFCDTYGTGYIDVSVKENCHGLKLNVSDDRQKVSIVDIIRNKEIYKISKKEIEECIKNKIKNIVYIKGDVIGNEVDYKEGTAYIEANADLFIDSIQRGEIVICSNIGSGYKDRGTQFRISEKYLGNLFSKKEEYKWI